MKKFFKNVLISFLIIFFIFNIINLISQIIQHYFIIVPELIEGVERIKLENKGMSAEEIYRLIPTVYSIGFGNKIYIQIMILLISILLSIALSLIFTFEEKYKFKLICYYMFGIIITSIIPTIFTTSGYIEISAKIFLRELLYYLNNTWIFYTLAFISIYIIKLIIFNKKSKALNEMLKNKQKPN